MKGIAKDWAATKKRLLKEARKCRTDDQFVRLAECLFDRRGRVSGVRRFRRRGFVWPVPRNRWHLLGALENGLGGSLQF